MYVRGLVWLLAAAADLSIINGKEACTGNHNRERRKHMLVVKIRLLTASEGGIHDAVG